MTDRGAVERRPRVEWERDVHVLEREGLVLTIARLPLRVPVFSYRLMSRGQAEQGPWLPSVKASFVGDIVTRRSALIAQLVTEAEDWIEAEHARVLHELDEERRARAEQSSRSGPASGRRDGPMRRGKTQRDRERRSARRQESR